MAEKSSGWLWGCGLGCAAAALITVALAFMGFRFVHRTNAPFDAAIETRETLDEQFGASDAYVPPPDGVVAPERMEAFLAVRRATAPARERLAGSWAAIPLSPAAAREIESQDFGEKMRSVLRITRSGIGIGARMGALYAARNRALLDAKMGLGEYTYVYVLAYYSWLGHSPADGPQNAGPEGEAEFGPRMGNVFIERIRRDLLAMLRHQLAALEESGRGDGALREALAGEIAAMEADRRRLPWQDGVPPQVAAGLEPYRERLEATYDPVTNAFELGRNRRRGRFSVEPE